MKCIKFIILTFLWCKTQRTFLQFNLSVKVISGIIDGYILFEKLFSSRPSESSTGCQPWFCGIAAK